MICHDLASGWAPSEKPQISVCMFHLGSILQDSLGVEIWKPHHPKPRPTRESKQFGATSDRSDTTDRTARNALRSLT